MKLSKTILSTSLFFIFFFGKAHSQCDLFPYSNAIDYINANKVKAAVLNGGDFFWNRNDGQFWVPHTPGQHGNVSALFAASIFLGGINANGELKAPFYLNRLSYSIGPINDNTLMEFDDGCINYDRIWKINRGDILWVKNDYDENGAIDLPIPDAVKSWPARGNPYFEQAAGFPLPDQDFAPFFDRNGNGFFDPDLGEYPLLDEAMPNGIPDEMTWSVFNSCPNSNNSFSQLAMGVEIHFMTYAFNCAASDPLNHTVFTRHKIINKSGVDYPEFRMGIWLDGDLGCYLDDFFGCDTTLNTQYYYNADNNDQDSSCIGILTYGIDPPMQAITFLNHRMSSFGYYNANGFNNPPPGTGWANNVDQFYNYLRGIWQDGTPMTYGGSGYNQTGDFLYHVFPDPPTDPTGWSMYNEQLPFFDRRTIMSAGPYEVLTGSHLVLDAAFSHHRQPGADHLENVNIGLSNVVDIQSFYDDGLIAGCTQADFCTDDCVWPGDANADGIAKNDDLLRIGVAMGKNAVGPQRALASHMWSPYVSDPWGVLPNLSLDLKHQDSNGDGKVDELDWHILEKNYGMRKPGYVAEREEAPFAEGGISVVLDTNQVSTTGYLLERRVRASVYLGSEDLPIDEIYGLTFSLKYDTSVWTFLGHQFTNFFETTFFGNKEDVMTIEANSFDEKFLELAIIRKDGQAVRDTFGRLGRINFVVREDARTGNPDGIDTLTFTVFDAFGVGADGRLFELVGMSETIIVKDMIYDSTLIETIDTFKMEDPAFLVAPNPNKGSFELTFEKTNAPSKISFFDFNGSNILNENIPIGTDKYSFNFSGKLPPGIYFVKWVQEDGQISTRKVVVK